jgi:hypothetical protein
MTESYSYLDVKALEDIRTTHRRSLAFLAGQAAGFGELYIPPPLYHQIEAAKTAIDAINQELARRGIQSTDPPPGTPVPVVVHHYHVSGDYIAGNSTTNGSVTISGGTVHGPITGVNQGTVNYQGGNQMSSGDTFNMSGNFSGAILNIKNTLTNTIQTVNGMAQAAPDQKQELAQLLDQLQAALATVPAEQAEAAETVAETAKDLVEKAAKEKPNKTTIQITGESLKAAATNLAGVLPAVIPVATQIVQAVQKLIGG